MDIYPPSKLVSNFTLLSTHSPGMGQRTHSLLIITHTHYSLITHHREFRGDGPLRARAPDLGLKGILKPYCRSVSLIPQTLLWVYEPDTRNPTASP